MRRELTRNPLSRTPRCDLLVNLASVGDQHDLHFVAVGVDHVYDTPIADAVTKSAYQFAGQTLDVVVPTGFGFQLCKSTREASGQRCICSGVEVPGLR